MKRKEFKFLIERLAAGKFTIDQRQNITISVIVRRYSRKCEYWYTPKYNTWTRFMFCDRTPKKQFKKHNLCITQKQQLALDNINEKLIKPRLFMEL